MEKVRQIVRSRKLTVCAFVLKIIGIWVGYKFDKFCIVCLMSCVCVY